MLQITIYILIFSVLLLLLYQLRSHTIWERLIGLNLIVLKTVLLITVYGVMTDMPAVLDISITYSIIGFLSVTLISRFLLRGGRLK